MAETVGIDCSCRDATVAFGDGDVLLAFATEAGTAVGAVLLTGDGVAVALPA